MGTPQPPEADRARVCRQEAALEEARGPNHMVKTTAALPKCSGRFFRPPPRRDDSPFHGEARTRTQPLTTCQPRCRLVGPPIRKTLSLPMPTSRPRTMRQPKRSRMFIRVTAGCTITATRCPETHSVLHHWGRTSPNTSAVGLPTAQAGSLTVLQSCGSAPLDRGVIARETLESVIVDWLGHVGPATPA